MDSKTFIRKMKKFNKDASSHEFLVISSEYAKEIDIFPKSFNEIVEGIKYTEKKTKLKLTEFQKGYVFGMIHGIKTGCNMVEDAIKRRQNGS